MQTRKTTDMQRRELETTTALAGPGRAAKVRHLDGMILDVLAAGRAEQMLVVARAVNETANDNTRFARIQAGRAHITFRELGRALRALEEKGCAIDLSRAEGAGMFGQKSFYDSLRDGVATAETLQSQLESLRDGAKREKGYLSRAFGIFSTPRPLEKAVDSVVSFEKYCRRNGVGFDAVSRQLVAGEKPRTAFDRIKDFRFLIAAAGGGVMGLAGLDLGAVPVLAETPGFFFAKALPWMAVPFIGFNIFKAFSQKNLAEDAGTFARFGAMMAAGFAISLGVTSAMSGVLPSIDPATLEPVAQAAGQEARGDLPFSPSHYILHVIGACVGASSAYKWAKGKRESARENAGEKPPGLAARAFNRVSGAFISGILGAGRMMNRGADAMEKIFNAGMNLVGIPAIVTLVSSSLSQQGLRGMAGYGGYYATVFTGMAAGAVALAAASYALGARRREFRAQFDTAVTAFSISSSLATMPTTRRNLRAMGVSDKTVSAVVPLGANFNMFGTSLYLGATAAAAQHIFNQPMGAADQLAVMSTVVLTAFGMPGMPASNISLLAPVLEQTGLPGGAIRKVYEMVVPGDRLLDMAQTSLNVTGDTVVALSKERKPSLVPAPVQRFVAGLRRK